MARWAFVFVAVALAACGSGSEADRRGVGAECQSAMDCPEDGQQCLAFRGGYCGIADCQTDRDCPVNSACVAHGDGRNYCFRTCIDKAECNKNRSVENESNCSANVDFLETAKLNRKACVPPSSSK